MALNKGELRAETKRLVGNRTATDLDDDWYDARVLSGYRQLCTFQGYVQSPGVRQPALRRLGFFELQDRQARSLSFGVQTTNFVTPDPATDVVTVVDVYDRTNNRGLARRPLRDLLMRDPDGTGRPTFWCPAGQGGVVGYYIDKFPGSADDDIDVYEYVQKYPTALASDTTNPVIPDVWHFGIALCAAVEAAQLLDMPEKATEMTSAFEKFIAARKSPIEESGFSGRAGQRRMVIVGDRR